MRHGAVWLCGVALACIVVVLGGCEEILGLSGIETVPDDETAGATAQGGAGGDGASGGESTTLQGGGGAGGSGCAMQTAGDCTKLVCTGGDAVPVHDPDDPEDDGNDCTADVCTPMGTTAHSPLAAGLECDDDGGSVCDGAGRCLGAPCNTSEQCPPGAFCVDGVCCSSTCEGPCKACDLPGWVGLCAAVPAGEDPKQGCPNGECGGTGNCEQSNGTACRMGAECLSGFCTDSVCCESACDGTCQSCNLIGSAGQCTTVPDNMDPADECLNGACSGGQCKLDPGQPCSSAGDCLSGFCPGPENVCCNNACNTTCKACNLPGSLGTCKNIPNRSDPADECAGAATCNGNAACVGLPNGAACTNNAQCSSTFCTDFVCCETICNNSECESCALPGSVGMCKYVAKGQEDPFTPCPAGSSCDGVGHCKADDGQPCAAGADCWSGLCADGVCCMTSCQGTCEACDLSGTEGTCMFIPAGTDPDNECDVPPNCNGGGMCGN